MKEIINQHEVMKKLLIFQLGLLAILLSACQQKSATTQQATPDSIYSVSHISRVYEKDRPKAFEIIRIAEEKKQLEAWQADSLRAKICLDDFYDLNKSIEYAQRTLTYDEVVSNPQRHLNMLTLISQIEVSLGRFSECIRFSDEGMKLAEELNDDNSACQLMINAGYSMYFMKEKKKGLEYMLRAESIRLQLNGNLSTKSDEQDLSNQVDASGINIRSMGSQGGGREDSAGSFGNMPQMNIPSMPNQENNSQSATPTEPDK